MYIKKTILLISVWTVIVSCYWKMILLEHLYEYLGHSNAFPLYVGLGVELLTYKKSQGQWLNPLVSSVIVFLLKVTCICLLVCLFICLFLCDHSCVCAKAFVWRSEENLQGSVLPFHHVGPRDQTQVTRLCGNDFDVLSHLAASDSIIFLAHGSGSSHEQGDFSVFTFSPMLGIFPFFNLSTLEAVYNIAVLIFISLMTSRVEHVYWLFVYLLLCNICSRFY